MRFCMILFLLAISYSQRANASFTFPNLFSQTETETEIEQEPVVPEEIGNCTNTDVQKCFHESLMKTNYVLTCEFIELYKACLDNHRPRCYDTEFLSKVCGVRSCDICFAIQNPVQITKNHVLCIVVSSLGFIGAVSLVLFI